jgi:hypothetical protein
MDMARLHRGGVSGEEVFQCAAALHLFAIVQPRTLAPHSRPFWFELARLTLNSRRRDPGNPLVNKHIGSRLPAAALEHLGKTVTSLLWPILTAMVEAMERQAEEPKTHQRHITEALASQPFAGPTTPTSKEQPLNA